MFFRTRVFVTQRYREPSFEPPIKSMSQDLLTVTFYQQTIACYLPVLCGIYFFFLIFGSKMVNIVIYGVFLWVFLKAYPNIIRSELLNDVKEIWGGILNF